MRQLGLECTYACEHGWPGGPSLGLQLPPESATHWRPESGVGRTASLLRPARKGPVTAQVQA